MNLTAAEGYTLDLSMDVVSTFRIVAFGNLAKDSHLAVSTLGADFLYTHRFREFV